MSRSASIVQMTRARLGAAVIMRQPAGPIVADGSRQLIELERLGAISPAEGRAAFEQIVQSLRTEVGASMGPKQRRKLGQALERASRRQLDLIEQALLLAEAEHALGRRSAASMTEARELALRDQTAILAMLRGFTLGND